MRKKRTLFRILLALALVLALAACGQERAEESDTKEDTGEHEHVWVADTASSVPATCGQSGVTAYKCSVSGCKETRTETAPATGVHTYGANSVCDVCGFIDMGGYGREEAIAKFGFYHIDKDSSGTYNTGDAVLFGAYPQSGVTDESILAALADYEPEETPGEGWASYGYYDAGQERDYMFYRDVELNGQRYRGVYMLAYRPYYFDLTADTDHSYIDDQGFELGKTYWFAFEPIEWDVLDYEGGRLLLSSARCLDGQPYQAVYEGDSAENITAPGGKNLNDWESSTIRAFLNGDFYAAAFNDVQKSLIPQVTLDNKTSGFGGNEYQTEQNDTQDRVFLLSYQDMKNESYGFLASSTARSRSYTQYALSQGMRPSGEGQTDSGEPSCYYILRSAGSTSCTVSGVSKKGTLSYEASPFTIGDGESHDGFAANGDLGVLPALYLKVGPIEWEEHSVSYTHTSGEEAQLDYALCFPKNYSDDGEPLPLIVYIPDATYRAQSIGKVETAEMPVNWVTEELMEKYPAVYLVLTLTRYSLTDSSSGDYLDALLDSGSEEYQVVMLIDSVCGEYNIDTDRLYLTGQSMGGIFDWALNYTYPEKFAATVYVACQPGGEVSTAEAPVPMYDTIIKDAKFADQTFVYIASRLDPKSSVGQDDVEAALNGSGLEEGVDYKKCYTLDPADPEGSSETIRELFGQGYSKYFLAFPQVADGSMQEHMVSFDLCYQIEAILEWLLSQSL